MGSYCQIESEDNESYIYLLSLFDICKTLIHETSQAYPLQTYIF